MVFKTSPTTSIKSKATDKIAGDPPVSIISIVNTLVSDAYKRRSSDIHINPTKDRIDVRFRIDGVLKKAISFPKQIHPEIVSRIKILAGLRTDEHQAPQDGRFRISTEGSENIDMRVSIVPSYYGENIVLRLLVDKAEPLTLETMGFSDSDRKKILRAVKKSFGMILATGPTGSGKTTTLYTLIKLLNNEERSIVTIEDPIEYAIDDIEQIQVNPRVGLTFANGLKSILRQDPNIIMVGEIRDSETASIAVNTALTGHLVLSTLHTNDASTTLPRLLEMGIESYLVASTVNLVIGQRLVRKICSDCKIERKTSASEIKSLSEVLPADLLVGIKKFYAGKGCSNCGMSGYRGRIGINEVLVADQDIKEAILRKASVEEIKKIAIKNGMTTMLQDGFNKAVSGLTTMEEVLRIIHE